jgi:hypothetical protein
LSRILDSEMSKARDFDDHEDHLSLAQDAGGGITATKVIAAASALALAAALFFGFFILRKRHEDQLSAAKRAEQAAQVSAPPQAQIFQDEVKLKGSQAVVGGTVKNISGATLEGLMVEVALKARSAQAIEKRPVTLNPDSLAPGEEGRYTLTISSDQWSGAQVVRLHSETRKADIPFKPELGEKRPAEKPPAAKVIIEQRPRRKGDDFINTPDAPIKIP